MSDERLFSLKNPWFTASVGATLGVALVSALIGFVWLPSVQRDAPFQGIWNAICSAAGVPRTWLAGGLGRAADAADEHRPADRGPG